MSDARELLPLYVLGVLSAEEARAVEQALAADPALATELASYREAAGALSELAPVVAPPAHVAERLRASAGAGRFERFAARLAQLYDVTVERAREYLGLIERPASWSGTGDWGVALPGISLVHFEGGPACATADCGFVRIAAGCTFPWHTHHGEELNLLIAGILRDHEGRRLRPGDELVQAAGTSHDITADPGEDVILAARVFVGIEVAPRT